MAESPAPAPAMTREEMQEEAELRMREIGQRFSAPLPKDKDELLKLLEDAETWLLRLDQKKTSSKPEILRQTKAVLISRDLLDHPHPDVKLLVTSCLTEITRIAAPESPYDDRDMKEVFKRIVDAFAYLSDINSPFYAKSLSILESVAIVRSCNLMLDLELDTLILEMFHHLFKAASVNDSETFIWRMVENILSVVIEESDDVHAELASYLLQNLTKEAQRTLPASFGLAQRIVGLCKDRLKPVFVQLLKGTPMDNYSDVVTFLCQDASNAKADNNCDAFGMNMVGENQISEILVSAESPQESSKSVQDVNCMEEYGTRPSITQTAESANGGSLSDNNKCPDIPPSQQKELSSDDDKAKTMQLICGDSEVLDSEPVATQTENPSDVIMKKSQGPNPSTESEMAEPAKVVMASDKLSLEPNLGYNKQQTETGKKVADGAAKLADTTPSVIVYKKRGRPSAAKSLEKKPVIRTKQGSDLKYGKVHSVSYSGGRGTTRQNRDDPKASSTEVSEGEFVKKQHTMSLETQKEEAVSDKDTDVDVDISRLKNVMSAKKTNNTKGQQEERGVSKRKRLQESEEAPVLKKNKTLNENLVGSRIKVWWPDDKQFYNGVVESFNASSLKHKIAYDDGDVEILQLKKEIWEFIDEEKDSDPGAVSDTPHARRGKGSSSLKMKEGNTGTPESGCDGGSQHKKRGRPKGARNSNNMSNSASSVKPKGKGAKKGNQ